MTRRYVLIDFETHSLVDLPEAGAWRYAEDWSTVILCLGYALRGANRAELWVPGDDTSELMALAEDPDVIFIAFNAGFEKAIWRHQMVPLGFPDIPNNRWHDIQAVAAKKGLPLDLDTCLRVLGLPPKDAEGSKLIKQVSNQRVPLTAEVRERIYTYCKTDIAVEWALHERIGWLTKEDRLSWLINQDMNERGLRLDASYIRACQVIVDGATPDLLARFRAITGLKPTQAIKLRTWCHENGAPLPNLSAETVEPALADGELPDNVHEALELRSLVASASVKKLGRMLTVMQEDERARGACQWHGTVPGRSAGRLFQPYNFPRGTTKVGGEPPKPWVTRAAIETGDHELVGQLIGPPVKTVVSGLRHCIVAERGKILVSGDYAGIQARVVLALAGQHDKTEVMAAGRDVYIDMAETIYKRKIDKKRDPYERQIGKFSVLGLGFGMGPPKFKLKYAKKDPLDFCQTVVSAYRKEWAPKVPFLWYGLEDAAALAVHNPGKSYEAHHKTHGFNIHYQMEDVWLTCRLPSGRKLYYFGATPEWSKVPWDETEVKRAFKYRAVKYGHVQTIFPFGGSLCENVVMGIEVDIHRKGMHNLHKARWPLVLEVYDEIVAEMPDGDRKRMEHEFEALMLDQDPWVAAMRIPVAVECWSGEEYRK